MKHLAILVISAALLVACEKNQVPVDLSHQAQEGSAINIDGQRISVFRQQGAVWAAYGGDKAAVPKRYISYRKERAIELKSGCRIDQRLSRASDTILVASVRCS